MSLKRYKEKRVFTETPEPKGKVIKTGKQLRFCVQKHHASHLHYDFRLEMEGVLKSWAVPKGPSLRTTDKRLAMMVEDHPIDYMTFEGNIPRGYGAGDVIVWDIGTYYADKSLSAKENERQLLAGLKKGDLKFKMEGKKLRGEFALVKIKSDKYKGKDNSWLLIKKSDQYAETRDVTLDERSMLSDATLSSASKQSEVDLRKAPKSKMPHEVKPMLATLVDKPFDDPDWLYEIKWDGYRAIAEVKNGKVSLYSRNHTSFNAAYSVLADSIAKLQHDAVLDGEIVALDSKGRSDFQALQYHKQTPAHLTYAVFDILYLNGHDLRKLPLIERKDILKQVVEGAEGILYSDHVIGKGIKLFKELEKQKVEGIMAKMKSSPYLEGKRTDYWQKIKTHNRQEAIICGYTEPKGSRQSFGSLVLGAYRDSKLRFIGHVGTGFDAKLLAQVEKELKPLRTKESPFNEKVPLNSPITWVKPKLLCEVKFAEWTREHIMRQPVFLGLRKDKNAKDVVEERPKDASVAKGKAESASVEITHPDKVYFPKDGITKGDVAEYYARIADTILPYLKDRPESLNRHPNGIDKPSFFQKNIEHEVPSFVETRRMESESKGEINFLLCQNKETLQYMANLGCIEINPWNSRADNPDKPDFMIIDLDPGDNTWAELVKVARTVHEVLDGACEENYLKTSGKTGLHIYVPLGGRYHYDEIRRFAELIANIVHGKLPKITSVERSPAKRTKLIYLDFLQNRRGQTLAAPYSLRPVQGAVVSTPLEWRELTPRLDPRKFNIKTIFKRLKQKGDLWKPVLGKGIDLKKSIECLEEYLKKG